MSDPRSFAMETRDPYTRRAMLDLLDMYDTERKREQDAATWALRQATAPVLTHQQAEYIREQIRRGK